MSEVDPLTRLAIEHGTDKFGPHFYTPVYHSLFSHLRDRPIRLLEIGVGGYGWKSAGGASLAMWAAYFPRAHIVSLDIEEKHLDLGPRVTLRQGSQEDAALLARLSDELGPFDVVIDDGSHVPEHVAASFEALFPRMSDGGLYAIEDVQTTFFPQFGGSAEGGATMRLASSILRHLHHAEIAVVQPELEAPPIARQIRSLRAFHNLLVIEKGDNDEPSNFRYRFDNPHAARALAAIEGELARAASPGGYTSLAFMLLGAGQPARAQALIEEALARWPDNVSLAALALDLSRDAERRLELLERLVRLGPDESRETVERIRAAILRGDPMAFTSSIAAGGPPPGCDG